MSAACSTVVRRPAGPAHDGLFRAQRREYSINFPNARYEVICVGSAVVGQVIVDECPDSVRIVDVIVHPTHRGRGIGAAVLQDVIAEAELTDRPVCLSVWSGNTGARRLYGRLGFVRTDHSHPSTVGYLQMQRETTSASADLGSRVRRIRISG
jgi:ribosomal protein S18 acetylase RimI-like enzyme